jgi:hypothetical protein
MTNFINPTLLMDWCPLLKTKYEITGDCRFSWHQLAFKVVMVHISVVGYLSMKCTISQSRRLIIKYSYNKNIVLLGSWKFLGLVAMPYLAIPLKWQQFLSDNLITKLNQSVMPPVFAGVEHHAFNSIQFNSEGMNTDWKYWKTGCWSEYWDIRER